MPITGRLIAESPIFKGNMNTIMISREWNNNGTKDMTKDMTAAGIKLKGSIGGMASAKMSAFLGEHHHGNKGVLVKLYESIFGGNGHAFFNGIAVTDTSPKDTRNNQEKSYDLKMGVRLNRDKMVMESESNYKMETLFKNLEFNFNMTHPQNMPADRCYKLAVLLKIMTEDGIRFGAGKTRGMGKLKLILDEASQNQVNAWLANGQNIPNNYSLIEADIAFTAENPLMVSWPFSQENKIERYQEGNQVRYRKIDDPCCAQWIDHENYWNTEAHLVLLKRIHASAQNNNQIPVADRIINIINLIVVGRRLLAAKYTEYMNHINTINHEEYDHNIQRAGAEIDKSIVKFIKEHAGLLNCDDDIKRVIRNHNNNDINNIQQTYGNLAFSDNINTIPKGILNKIAKKQYLTNYQTAALAEIRKFCDYRNANGQVQRSNVPYDKIFNRELVWGNNGAQWRIVINGSTFKGAFGTRAEKIVNTICTNRAIYEHMFGRQNTEGALIFDSAYLDYRNFDPNNNWSSMDAIRINPATGKPIDGSKMDFLFAAGRDFKFNTKISLRKLDNNNVIRNQQLVLFLHLLRDLNAGLIPIGGLKTSGCGWIKPDAIKIKIKCGQNSPLANIFGVNDFVNGTQVSHIKTDKKNPFKN